MLEWGATSDVLIGWLTSRLHFLLYFVDVKRVMERVSLSAVKIILTCLMHQWLTMTRTAAHFTNRETSKFLLLIMVTTGNAQFVFSLKNVFYCSLA